MSLLGLGSCHYCAPEDDLASGTVKIDMEAAIAVLQKQRGRREMIEARVRAGREIQDRLDAKQIIEQREAIEKKDAMRAMAERRLAIVAEEMTTAQRQKEVEEADRKLKLDKLLMEYGVAEVSQKKKTLMRWKYPIHHAVEKRDAEAVYLLLHFKADPSLLNSSKKTALQLAEKGKMLDERILSMLRDAVTQANASTIRSL